jgi:hydrogenase maturation protein HypF
VYDSREVLAVGAELKSAFCITKGHFAYLSQHIGDMGTLETQRAFERALEHMLRLFRVAPAQVVCDLHPGYHSSRWAAEYAERMGVPLLRVQHHHAHVAALVAESGLALDTPAIGIAFDGTGYGTDGAIWGGEALLVRGREFERFEHLHYVPMAGGDASIRTPARAALSYLRAAGIGWDSNLACVGAFTSAELSLLDKQLERRVNCADTSSMGRLFDAVSALIGVRQKVTYEGQAAIELESLCGAGAERCYPLPPDPGPMLRCIAEDLRAGVSREEIAGVFHETIAQWVAALAREARSRTGVNLVGLTGGVFQNLTLLRRAAQLVRDDGFELLTHRLVPANDGGLSLGQAVLATIAGRDTL